MNSWMSIDPGLGGTGYAVWRKKELIVSGSVTSPEKEWARLGCIANSIARIGTQYSIEKAYYELPQFIAGRYEVNASGDLVKLCLCAGAIVGNLEYHRCETEPVRVIDWKGQMKKEMTKDRVLQILQATHRRMPTVKAPTHEIDAIGIGLYTLGEL